MARYSEVATSDEAVLVETDDFAIVFNKSTQNFYVKRWNSDTSEWETLFTIKSAVGYTVPIAPQDCINQSMSADSTGVKFTSVVKTKVDARYLKKIRLRASWTASNTDSVTEVRLIGTTTGTIASVSGNTGTDEEAEGTTFTDNELVYIEVAVTTASATAGATTTLTYAIIEFIYEMV